MLNQNSDCPPIHQRTSLSQPDQKANQMPSKYLLSSNIPPHKLPSKSPLISQQSNSVSSEGLSLNGVSFKVHRGDLNTSMDQKTAQAVGSRGLSRGSNGQVKGAKNYPFRRIDVQTDVLDSHLQQNIERQSQRENQPICIQNNELLLEGGSKENGDYNGLIESKNNKSFYPDKDVNLAADFEIRPSLSGQTNARTGEAKNTEIQFHKHQSSMDVDSSNEIQKTMSERALVGQPRNLTDTSLQLKQPQQQKRMKPTHMSSNDSCLDNQPYASKFALEHTLQILPNIPSASRLDQQKIQSQLPPRAGMASQSQPPDNIHRVGRKMSAAAKSGQLQIFGGLNHQLRSLPQPAMTESESVQQSQVSTGVHNLVDSKPSSTIFNQQAPVSSDLHHSEGLSIQSKSGPFPRNNDLYLSKQQVIDQQREKKQELLKQLDSGNAHRQQSMPSVLVDYENFKQPPLDLTINGVSSLALAKNKTEFQSHRRPDLSQTNPVELSNSALISPAEKSAIGHLRGPNPLVFQNQAKINIDRRRFKPLVSDQINLNPPQSSKNLVYASHLSSVNSQTKFSGYIEQLKQNSSNNLSNRAVQSLQEQTKTRDAILALTSDIQKPIADSVVEAVQEPSQTQYVPSLIEPFNQSPQKIESTQSQIDSQTIGVEEQQSTEKGCKIGRKLEGRVHKVYDYMFIQMSHEHFIKEYSQKRILLLNSDSANQDSQNQNLSPGFKQSAFSNSFNIKNHDKPKLSPIVLLERGQKGNNLSPHNPSILQDAPNLSGLVKIKAYDNQLSDEMPQIQCNLLPTQLDHLKVLMCEQEDKNHPRLTQEASNRFEIEKQNQIKQYMEDIIAKLQQKQRRFKVTVKRKFIEDALSNSSSLRVASVYVIVLNREKTYDPLLNQKPFKSRKYIGDSKFLDSSSEEDEAEKAAREEYQRKRDLVKVSNELGVRKSVILNIVKPTRKRSMYDSDTGADNLNSTSASSGVNQFRKIKQEKKEANFAQNNLESEQTLKPRKVQSVSTGPTFKRQIKKEEENQVYKYSSPRNDFGKYGQAKIRIFHDITAYEYHKKHPLNIFFNQFNEFVRLVFKNQKPGQTDPRSVGLSRANTNYLIGLGRALGLNLKKDSFGEQNLKSREYLNQMKEKLMFQFWRKITEENASPLLNSNIANPLDFKKSCTDTDIENDSVDSSSNQNNTPRSQVEKNGEKASFQFFIPPGSVLFKYVVGKGNNSIMVKNLFKNRFWWMPYEKEEMEKCNFIWTQIKNAKIMEVLPCLFPNNKSGIKNCAPGSALVNQTTNSALIATPQQKSSKKKKLGLQNSDKTTNGKTEKGDKQEKTVESRSNQDILNRFMELKLYNKIEDNFHMNNKKALFMNFKNYYEALGLDVFDFIPLTFHLKNVQDDPQFQKFKQYYFKTEEEVKNKRALLKKNKQLDTTAKVVSEEEEANSPLGSPEKKLNLEQKEGGGELERKEEVYQTQSLPRNIWIIKPGENTNRGHGIQVAKEFDEIQNIVREATSSSKRTCIVQRYIHNPLLINRRKFDIRTYVLMTSVNGHTKMYIYEEGYLRTSCREFSINNLSNRLVHLTNDAVQKKAEDYGKFEPGNKLSYNEFQVFLDKNYPDLSICFERDILPQMNKLTTDIFRACHGKLDPKRRLNCMEVFGLDFMIDDEFRPYLIEVNTNPCLELSAPILARLIPTMLENALKIGMDAIFLPPEGFSQKKAFIGDPCPENRFELFFDSKVDGPGLEKLFQQKQNVIFEMDEDDLSEEEEHDD